MLVEPSIFTEDKSDDGLDTYKAVKKYFPETKLLRNSLHSKLHREPFRGSMDVARRMGERFEFANCLNWLPKLRQYALNSDFRIVPFDQLLEDVNRHGIGNGLFVRPVSSMKEFSGQLFTKVSKLEQEYNWAVKNCNREPTMLCIASGPKEIKAEFRCIFVNRKLVTTTQYMIEGKPMTAGNFSAPWRVQDFAQEIANHSHFENAFEFVIDIAILPDLSYKMVEVNAFETASFYFADLDLIYKAWAQSIEPPF